MATNYWSSLVKFFGHNGIEFKDGIKIFKLTSDPTSVAADAAQGSIGIFGELLYVKQDAGSTVNWISYKPSFENTAFDSINEINGPVTHMGNLQKVYAHLKSSGIDDGCEITDNLNGTVNIALGVCSIRPAADSHSNMLHANIAATGILTPVDGTASYLYIDYNAGSPQWVITTSETDTNGQDKILGFLIARRGNILKIIDTRSSTVDFANKAGILFKDFGTFLHKEGGSILGASGLNVTVTAGRFWYGVNPIPHDAFDTSIAGILPANVFVSIYGAYTITDDVKLLDNVNYDNAGVLTGLGVGKWKVDWLYMVNDTPSTLALIYGDTQYNNKAAAELATAPIGLPPALSGVGTLIGRYLIQEGVAGAEAQSIFTTTFSAATVTNHNDLASLQGGQVDEYYHDTAAENARQILLEKESEVRWLENFRLIAPTTEYTESGGTVTAIIADDMTDELDGIQSAKVTTVATNQGSKITSSAKTGLQPVDYQTSGFLFDWQYDGLNGDWNLVIEESTDGVTYTENARLELPKQLVSEPASLIFKLNSVAIITHYRHYFEMVGETVNAIARWDNVKVVSRPFNYKEVTDKFEGLGLISGGFAVPTIATAFSLTSLEGDGSLSTGGILIEKSGYYNIENQAQVFGNGETYYFGYDVNGTIVESDGRTLSTDGTGVYEDAGRKWVKVFLNEGDIVKPAYRMAVARTWKEGRFHVSLVSSTQSQAVFKGQATDTEWTDGGALVPNTGSFGTVPSNKVLYKRSGQDMDVDINVYQNGAGVAGSGVYLFTIPNGKSFGSDVSKSTTLTVNQSATLIGSGELTTGEGNIIANVSMYAYDDTRFWVHFGATVDDAGGSNSSTLDPWGSANRSLGNTIITLKAKLSFPINGWKVSDPMIAFPITNDVENDYTAIIDNAGAVLSQGATYIVSTDHLSGTGRVNIFWPTDFFGDDANKISVSAEILDVDGSTSSTSISNITTSSARIFTEVGGSASWRKVSVTVKRQADDYKKPTGGFLGNLSQPVGCIKEIQASGVNGHAGATFSSGSYVTRFLNTIEGDFGLFGTLLANQFTLEAGTYEIDGLSPARNCNRHKTKVRNITDSTDAIVGMSTYSHSVPNNDGESKFYGIITINSSKTFEIQHRNETTFASTGFGIASGFGEDEVYTTVKIRKLR